MIFLCWLCVWQTSFSSLWSIFSGPHHSLWVLMSYGVSVFLLVWTSPFSTDLLLICPWGLEACPCKKRLSASKSFQAEALLWLTGWGWKPSAAIWWLGWVEHPLYSGFGWDVLLGLNLVSKLWLLSSYWSFISPELFSGANEFQHHLEFGPNLKSLHNLRAGGADGKGSAA